MSMRHRQKMADSHRGEKHYLWKGRIYDKDGYVLLNKPDHRDANPNGYIREHRYVMEKCLGRMLDKKEVVHHINGIKDDNRIENLQLFSASNEHMKHEYKNGNLKHLTSWKYAQKKS